MRTRWFSAATIALLIIAVLGCSGKSETPLTPASIPDSIAGAAHSNAPATLLWGYFEIYMDIPTATVTAVEDRTAMFAANVVNFLNGKATSLGFHINGTNVTADYVDVDIDVSITHPFPGMPQYNGYDVRGVFMGDGSDNLIYNPYVIYPVLGTDQFMPADPVDGFGGPDGYTRWFNLPEFSFGGAPLFQYTQGKLATPGFAGSATLNPYRYYSDGLGATDDVWTWLNAHPDQHGQFSSGATNTRNYYLRFPNSTGIKYGYAVVANWESEDVHPSNAPEAVAASVVVTPDIYFESPTAKGGDLILDAGLYNWSSQPAKIFVESTVLTAPHQFTPSEMIPTGGGLDYSTYHAEIPADKITGTTGNEFWVIAECGDADYTNPYGVPNYADTEKLAAFFRYDLPVAGTVFCKDLMPVVDTLNGKSKVVAVTKPYTGWIIKGDMFEDGTPGVAVNDGTSDIALATNVDWVDINTLTFDLDLTDVPMGTYDIVVINGCGEKKRATVVDMLTILRHVYVVGTPNIDVVTGNPTPTDIAIDPSSDQVAISYNNTWRRWSNDYTVSSSPPYVSWSSMKIVCWDATSTFMWYAHPYPPFMNQALCWSWCDWTGFQQPHSLWQPGAGNRMTDIANLQGTEQDWGLYDWKTWETTSGSGPQLLACFMSASGLDNFNYNSMLGAPFYNGQGTTGVVMENVRAIDLAPYSGSGYPYFYLLEYLPDSNTGVVETYIQTGAYQGVSFGEGIFNDPLDLTTDSIGNIYVLDKDSTGKAVIWAFDPAGILIGTSEPCPPEEISGSPLRMDAHVSKDPDEVHVLHTLGVTRFAM
jgi:hypothetical protein